MRTFPAASFFFRFFSFLGSGGGGSVGPALGSLGSFQTSSASSRSMSQMLSGQFWSNVLMLLSLDRRLHPGFPLHLPADVDLQAGVRRVRPLHRPPQVLLN